MENSILPPNWVLRTTRRIACDVCRERKVRCDRNQPSCQRCVRLGNLCAYTLTVLRKKRNPNIINVSDLLTQMHSRLTRAEAQLAKDQTTDTLSDFDNSLVNPSPEYGIQTEASDSLGYFPKTPTTPRIDSASDPSPKEGSGSGGFRGSDSALWEQWIHNSGLAEFNDELQSTTSIFMLNKPEVTMDDIYDLPTSAGFPNIELVVDEPSLHSYYQSYFETVHTVLPMLNRDKFEAGTRSLHRKLEFNALRYAVAMVGASACDEQSDAAENLYALARRNLEEAEREDSGESFLTLSAVQTLLLITFYEVKKKSLPQIWMSVGRGLRLAKAMELDHPNREADEDGNTGVKIPLSPTSDPLEMEERYSTFWCAYFIDSYVSVRTCCSPTFGHLEVTACLPIAEDAPFFQPRIRLLDAVTDPMSIGTPSAFCGLAIMSALANMVSMHRLKAASPRPSQNDQNAYPFWSEHLRLDGTISTVMSALLDRTLLSPLPVDLNAILISLNLHAVTIYLHELAIKRSDWDKNIPQSLILESHSRSGHAAMEIITVLCQVKSLNTEQAKILKQMNTFTMWSLSVASGVLIRIQGDSCDTTAATRALKGLWILHAAIVNLEDESASFGTLLENLVMHLAMFDTPSVR